jgi:hypothetical protein
MNEEQKFQSKAQLTALKVHAVYMKVENVITFPFRWLASQVSQTEVFVEKPARKLRVVKPT